VKRTALVRLQLHRFRSHRLAEFELSSAPVILFGANGAGKTNILEAISLLAPGRGLRRATYQEAGQRNSDAPWAINAELQLPDRNFSVGTGLDGHSNRRLVRIDGSNSTAGALGRLLRQVWLTPAQDRIFSGPRGTRLRFFDRLVFSLFPDHGKAVSSYEKAMRGRQKLLDDGGSDPAWLSGLEQQMANFGANMIINRDQTILRLRLQIKARSDSAFPQAGLELQSDADLAVTDNSDAKEVEAWLLEGFTASRNIDAKAGRTLSGPHRADLAVHWPAKQMPASDCSTGEQKALLVGLTLAHARAVTADSNSSPPLILLDEACAHLDIDRRAALIDELCQLKGQAWLTGTDRDLFAKFNDDAQFFEVSETGIIRV